MDLSAAKETIAKAATEVDRLRALLEASKDFYRSNPKQSEKWAREALKLAKKLKDAESEARAHYNLGATLFEMSSLAEAAKEFETAAALDRPAEFLAPLLDRPLFALGRTLSKQGKYKEAYEYLDRALKISRTHHRKSEIDILTAIGNAALEQADYPKALDVQYQALALLDKEDDPLRRAIVFASIAGIYFDIKYFEKAESFLDRAHTIANSLDDALALSSILQNRGSIAKEQGHFDQAKELLKEALTYAKKVGRAEIEAYVEDTLGAIALSEGALKAAFAHYSVSEERATEIALRTVLIASKLGKGAVLHQQKRFKEAITVLEQSIQLAEDAGVVPLLVEGYRSLASAYEQQGKLNEAVAAYNKFIEYNSQFNDQQRQRQLLEISARVEIEKADRERERMERLAKDAETRAELLREETERQSKELTQLALQLIQKNEFLCDLKEELEPQLKSAKQAKAIAQRIDDHIRSDRDWETFENQFSAVHRDFLVRLSATYPSLTPTELKIATMIKLNLPSKAIANLFCLSLRTVENHRLSIRKKLSLTGDANLVSFFTAFGGDNAAA